MALELFGGKVSLAVFCCFVRRLLEELMGRLLDEVRTCLIKVAQFFGLFRHFRSHLLYITGIRLQVY